ncbi:MAG: hypothetical protein ACREFR_19375, partial [Limisphaerales bacterium]
EQGINYLEAGLAACAVGFGEAFFKSMVVAIKDILPMIIGLGVIADTVVAGLGTVGLGKLLHDKKIENSGKESMDNAIKAGAKMFGAGTSKGVMDILSGAGGIGGDVKAMWDKTLANAPHDKLDRLKDLFASLSAAGMAGAISHATAAPGVMQNFDQTKMKPEFTSLEKMGFIMSGKVNNPYEQQKVNLLEKINAGIKALRTQGNDPISPAVHNSI